MDLWMLALENLVDDLWWGLDQVWILCFVYHDGVEFLGGWKLADMQVRRLMVWKAHLIDTAEFGNHRTERT